MQGQHSGMPTHGSIGRTALERLLWRYENTVTKCPECGYLDEEGNWTSQTDGREIMYHHTCPSCGASRDHTFSFDR